jgi:hypothetical protein
MTTTKKKKPDVRAGIAVRIFLKDKRGGEYVRRSPQELYDAATKVIKRRIGVNRRGIEFRNPRRAAA